ncbi:MAG TPA: hypothetical protein VGP26_16945 [Actinophytocola sp.]|jgi:hypothetical protein|nr:hypothetical protein [Actinophytocola sp.]
MASTISFRNDYVFWIPPDGTAYVALGPDGRFGSGAITVSAVAKDGVGVVGFLVNQYIEVVQMAVRTQWATSAYTYYLDIVVRNNAHVGGPGTGFSHWSLNTSITNP